MSLILATDSEAVIKIATPGVGVEVMVGVEVIVQVEVEV